MTEISEKEVQALAEVLLGRVNAPEQEIYRAARDGLEAAALARAEANAGEPVAWGEDIDGKIVSVRLDKSRHCTVPLYPAPQPSGMVKALEWKKPKELRFRAACTHFGYEYFIDQTPNGWLLQTYLFGDEYWETLGSYPALDDAMYAAQADYERRIRSAIAGGDDDTL